jgi:RimJ/RimL family protein N-acetyltransferase
VNAAFVTDDVAAARATLERYAHRQADEGARLYGTWKSGVLVGMFTNLNAAMGKCEIGCCLEPAVEGHGLVTQSCGALLEWAFSTSELHRAEWHCRADNDGSAAAAQRLGMTLEGVHREIWPYLECTTTSRSERSWHRTGAPGLSDRQGMSRCPVCDGRPILPAWGGVRGFADR